MSKKVKLILTIIALSLIITNIVQLININNLNNRIANDIEFIISKTTRHLPKDYILLILTKEHIDVNELYQAIAYIDASQSYTSPFLSNNQRDITDFSFTTKKEIEKLIKLIESNADQNSIDNQVDFIINIQNDALNMYKDN